MTKILCLESSTEVCSVAFVEDGVVVDFREDRKGLNHAKLLTVFIDDLLKSNCLKAGDLSALAVSEGPGSYTGLRIGVSAAKGICYAVEIPLIAISPLEAMANHLIKNTSKYGLSINPNELIVPMIDARRMEVYAAIYNHRGGVVRKVDALIIDRDTFATELAQAKVYFVGNGTEKCKTVIDHENAVFIDGIVASALNMADLAQKRFDAQQFVDVAYFEPFYLKNFIATTPKNSVLNTLVRGKN